MTRISFGLVGLVLSLLVAARALDLTPDPETAAVRPRVAAVEAVAIESSLAAQRQDVGAIEAFARAVKARNPEVLSVGVRDTAGKLVVNLGDHPARWVGNDPAASTPSHMHVPVSRDGEPWGTVEVAFKPLPFGGPWRLVGGALFPLLAFTAVAGFVVVRLYLRAVFRRVDLASAQVMPDRVRATLNVLSEGVMVLDKDQTVVHANDGFARTVGRPASEIEGRKASDLPWAVVADAAAAADYPWAKALRDATTQTGTVLTLDGRCRRTVSVNATPIFDGGVCRGALATIADLTPVQNKNVHLRRLLRQLRKSRAKIAAQKRAVDAAREAAEQANRAKGLFLANVSHEIRTPMNAIIGLTEAVLEGTLAAEHRECLDVVAASAGSLLGVINDLLDLSKIEAGRFDLDPTDFDLRAVLEDALQTLAGAAHGKGLELVCDVGFGVPPVVRGDPVRLRQVLINLVGNALKFTAAGEVVVGVRGGIPDGTGGTKLQFTVSDTGIGIPADKLQDIFEPFVQADGSTTRRFGGTGLGLSISTRLVGLMGGTVWAESKPGLGSTFHFTARFAPAKPVAATMMDLVIEEPLDRPVLVVDDNATALWAACNLLEELGLRPTGAGGAAEAVAELRRAALLGDPFPLVLVDSAMPDADGFALAEQLRDEPGLAAGVVVMVGSADPRRDIERCPEVGAAGYVRKPLRKADLLRAVRAALDPTGAHAGPAADPAPAPDDGPPVPSLRVLLADDNPFNRKVATLKLTRDGHRVTAVGCGHDALAVSGREAFDVLFTDVQMPDMDGFELTAAVRERERGTGRRLPVVAMTAHAMKGDRERCLGAGMDDYVAKPVRDDDLRRALRNVAPAADAPAEPPGVGDDTVEFFTLPASASAALDETAVLARVGGNRDTLRELAGVFREDCAELLAEIDAAVTAGHAARVRAAAHTVKGMVGFFDARGATAAASDLERLGESGDLSAAAAAAETLAREVGGVSAALEPYCREADTVGVGR